jgi:hypothetical protein
MSGVPADLGLHIGAGDGAGDGNRTRTISLGIRPIGASDRHDLGSRGTGSDRDEPCDTGLMARQWPGGLAYWPSLVSSSRPFTFAKIASCATRGICSQTAVPATQRSASCSFWPRPCPVRTHQGTKRGICLRQVRSWPHDLCPGCLALQALEPARAPAGQPGPIPKFGNADEG